MSESIEFKISGLSELQKSLEQLPRDVARKVLRTSLRDAANQLKTAMAEAAPRESGFLHEHFGIKIKLRGDELAGSAFIGPQHVDYPRKGTKLRNVQRNFEHGKAADIGSTRAASTIARFQEFGTSKMAAHPFMRPAFEANKEAMLSKIVEGIREALAKYGGR